MIEGSPSQLPGCFFRGVVFYGLFPVWMHEINLTGLENILAGESVKVKYLSKNVYIYKIMHLADMKAG